MITKGVEGEVDAEPIATSDCSRKNGKVSVYSVDDDAFYEIPTVDSTAEEDQVAIEVEIAKDGPASITRLSDIYVPAVWKGENVWEKLPLGPDDRSVPVRVEARKYDESSWTTIHYGWLRKIGSGGEGRLLRFRVDDFSKLLQGEYVSEPFETHEAEVETTVANHVVDTLNEKGIDFGFRNDADLDTGGSKDPPGAAGARTSGTKSGLKYFEADRDTLVDVMDWAAGLVDGGHWYVDDDGTKPVIVLDDGSLGAAWASEEASDESDGTVVTVRRNNALVDIDPVNTFDVRGKSGVSIEGYSIPGGSLISDKFPVATVRHEELYERANETAHRTTKEVEAITIDGAEKRAKELLREEISGAGESSMVLNGTPDVLPWDTITSRPVCNELIQTDVPPITFGIEGVIHSIPATGLYTTEIETSVSVSGGDIVVVDSGMTKGKGTEESADSRQTEDTRLVRTRDVF